jgi:hypothetical protein
MSSDPTFDAAATAFAQVQTTVTLLQTEYANICAQIADTKNQLAAVPQGYLPLADLQAGILDFIDSSGLTYGKNEIEGQISSFALGYLSGGSRDTSLNGKPLRFCDMEAVVNGHGFIQLLTPYKNQFNDQVLYCLFAQLVKQGLSALMAQMPPAAFGYDKIDPAQIGSDRVTRRAAIVALNTQLGALQAQKADLASKLIGLGMRIPS